MTTPTPRTDAIALDRNDSHRHPDCSDRIVGWTDYEALRDRSREIERDLAARDAELAEVMKWKEAVINELIVAHIYSQAHDDSPRKAIQDAITWNCQVALDPAVSSDAQRLRDTHLQRAEAAERKAEEAARDAGRWKHVRRKVCFSGNGDGTATMQIINLPMAAKFPEIGEHEKLADETIDAAIDAKGEA